MGLDELRDEIREKDIEIIRLISERTEIAKKIGEIKLESGLPIVNTDVEKKVISRYVDEGMKKGFSAESMKTLASTVIKEAVSAESVLLKGKSDKKVAVIGGNGKMGGWIADLLSASGNTIGIVDPSYDNSLELEDCKDYDVVILSVPIHVADPILSKLENICGPDTLVFDLTSLKSPIASHLKSMAKKMKVCSVHPMFGPSAKSMHGRNLIICDCGNEDAVKETEELFDDRGGNIRIMDIDEHDSYMSYVLGLTHAVNIALFTVLERSGYSFDDLKSVASTTFNKGLDTNMSVASEDPMLYYEIQHMNSHKNEMWTLFSEAVNDLKEKSLSDDPEGFIGLMEKGKEYFYGPTE